MGLSCLKTGAPGRRQDLRQPFKESSHFLAVLGLRGSAQNLLLPCWSLWLCCADCSCGMGAWFPRGTWDLSSPNQGSNPRPAVHACVQARSLQSDSLWPCGL